MQRLEDLPLLSVSDLNRQVSLALEHKFPLVRLEAEISQVTRAASGHWYLTLKDASASVRAVMFRREALGLAVAPREGLRVEVRGQPSLYEPRGDFQLRVLALKPAGEGDLFALFMRLKARLQVEGLFDEERKRALPEVVRRVGVITSPSGAALHDFLVTLGARAPMAQAVLFPSLVQGADAPQALLEALSRARSAGLDVLAVVRGGGSLEDLWAFNDETFVRALAAFPVPVVSGVGHETDTTLTDFVADLRAATPTAAAEQIAAPHAALRLRLQQQRDSLRWRMRRILDQANQRMDRARGALRSPRAELRAQTDRLASAAQRFRDIRSRMSAQERQRLSAAARALEALNPLAVLARGYAVVLDATGSPVTQVGQLEVGQGLALLMQGGQAQVQVKSLAVPSESVIERSS